MQASKGKQRQAGRGRQEKRRERKNAQTSGAGARLGLLAKQQKVSTHPDRQILEGIGSKNKLQKQQKTSTQIGRYIRGLAQKTKWQQLATNGHPYRQIH